MRQRRKPSVEPEEAGALTYSLQRPSTCWTPQAAGTGSPSASTATWFAASRNAARFAAGEQSRRRSSSPQTPSIRHDNPHDGERDDCGGQRDAQHIPYDVRRPTLAHLRCPDLLGHDTLQCPGFCGRRAVVAPTLPLTSRPCLRPSRARAGLRPGGCFRGPPWKRLRLRFFAMISGPAGSPGWSCSA
jgi:hypothetical protein